MYTRQFKTQKLDLAVHKNYLKHAYFELEEDDDET